MLADGQGTAPGQPWSFSLCGQAIMYLDVERMRQGVAQGESHALLDPESKAARKCTTYTQGFFSRQKKDIRHQHQSQQALPDEPTPLPLRPDGCHQSKQRPEDGKTKGEGSGTHEPTEKAEAN